MRMKLAVLVTAATLALAPSFVAATVVAPSANAAASDPCAAGGNPIVCENSKPGSPASEWDVDGAGDADIQGFATDISVNVGSRVDFKIDTPATAYTVTIYRSGYYGGLGARKIATLAPTATLPQHQPSCISDVTTELYDCGTWAVSASWNVPATAVSGVYFARLAITQSGSTNGDASQIPFIVRNDASHSDVLFQTSDSTWQAYNTYGGASFYQGAVNGRAYKLSYNRPFNTRDGITAHDYYFANEYPMVRFLERNGYDVSYTTDLDSDRYGSLIKNHKVFMSVGHDEYWSAGQRANVEAARDAGVNLQFLSGNEAYWHTRWEPSADGTNTANRTLVSYKETWSNAKIDPTPEWTGTWRDPRFAPPGQGAGKPENNLTGTLYMANSDDLAVTVSAEEGKNRLWRNTSVATLPAGGSATLAKHTIGYESDEDLDNGFRPAGLIRLSTTTGATPEYLRDFGSVVSPGTTTHHLTLYRAASGALVFSAGSIQYTWGLDAEHDSPYAAEPADPRMQQAEVNLLADMSAQPATLMSGLVAATKSTDTTGPTVSIATPASGATRANGAQLTVSGTATDTGGGRVAGVEVSMDAGDTWHPATGTSSWTYTAIQHGAGADAIRVRAVDDSANIGAVASRPVTVTCPCSAFGAAVPTTPAAADTSAVELGTRFTPSVDGQVSGVRFYKGSGNGGTHVGRLWSPTGELLASVTFTGESATGWQSATFSQPVFVTGGTTYTVSYTAPQGHYAADDSYFSSRSLQAAPFTLAGGYGAPTAGVYGTAGTVPTSTYGNANYYVDVLFSTSVSVPLTVSNRFPVAGSTSVPRTSTVHAVYSRAVTAGSARLTLKDSGGTAVAGTSTYDSATRTVTFTPSAPLPGKVKYTAVATGTDSSGNQVDANGTWTFTSAEPQAAPGVCPCSLFSDELQPTVTEDVDASAVTLGVRFSVDTPGTISAIRFYKAAGNSGTHTGTLWNAAGQQLATGTFTDESTSGWQTLTLSSPVSVTTGTEYVASYRTSVGRYSTSGTFSSANLSRSPLLVGPSAGAYTYGTGFPDSQSSANYMVDVVFQRPAPAIAITSQDPSPNALDVPTGNPVRVWFSTDVTSAATLTAAVNGTAVAGTQTLDNAGTRLSLVPSAPWPAGATVTVALTNVRSTSGAALADQTWTFKVATSAPTAAQTLFGDTVPQTAAEADSAPVELGTAFVPTKDGVIRALRFHKGAGNGGTHVGSLWSATGTRLAQATYTNETPTGWQRVALASPVHVTAGQTYVVSYLAPQGHYSSTAGFFGSALTSGDLTAPATNNGRYLYASGGGFPTSSYHATNYFVDVEFVPDAPPAPTIAVTAQTPSPGATAVATDTRPTITFSAPIADGYAVSAAAGGSPIAGSTTLSSDRTKLTFVPSAALPTGVTVTMTVTGVISQDGATSATQTWSFGTAAAPPTGTTTTLLDSTTPSTAAAADSDAVELGVRFSSSVAGQVTAIRFWKGAGNGGVHTGSLWSSSGTRLATGTFDAETASGWQTMVLDTPVTIAAGTTYVASYLAPQGHYAVTPQGFSSAYVQGPLTVPASGGVYRYGAGGGFPTSSYQNGNYSVGVVFRSSQ